MRKKLAGDKVGTSQGVFAARVAASHDGSSMASQRPKRRATPSTRFIDDEAEEADDIGSSGDEGAVGPSAARPGRTSRITERHKKALSSFWSSHPELSEVKRFLKDHPSFLEARQLFPHYTVKQLVRYFNQLKSLSRAGSCFLPFRW